MMNYVSYLDNYPIIEWCCFTQTNTLGERWWIGQFGSRILLEYFSDTTSKTIC